MDPQIGIRLWFVQDGDLPHFLIVVREFLDIKLPEQRIMNRRTNSVASLFIWLQSLTFFISGDISSPPFALRKSVKSKTCINEYNGFDTIRTTPGIFSGESGSHCADVQRPALKLKVDISCIQHNFFLVLWCNFTFCRFGRTFFAHPVYHLHSLKIYWIFSLGYMVSELYPSPDVPKIHIFTQRREQFFPTVTNQQVGSVDFQADRAMDEIQKPCDPQRNTPSSELQKIEFVLFSCSVSNPSVQVPP